MSTVYSTWNIKAGFPVDGLTVSVAVTGGNIVTIDSNGQIKPAQANAVATLGVAVALQDYAVNKAAGALYSKALVLNAGSGLTPGGRVYLSPTVAGGITQTQPTTAGQFVQAVGIALNATDVLYDIQIGGVVLGIQAVGSTSVSYA